MSLTNPISNEPGVYIITDKDGSKIYVGSAKNLHYRRRKHLERLKKGNASNPYLQKFFNDLNGDIKFIYITTVDRNEAYDLEQSILDEYSDSGKLLNIDYNARGNVFSDHHKTRLSHSARRIRSYPIACYDHVTQSSTIYESTPDILKATGVLQHHVLRSLEKLDKGEWVTRGGYSFQKFNDRGMLPWLPIDPGIATSQREAYFARLASPDYGPNAQPVEMYNVITKEVTEFPTIADCARYLNVETNAIKYAMGALSKRSTDLKICGDYIFRYKGSNRQWKNAVPLKDRGRMITYAPII